MRIPRTNKEFKEYFDDLRFDLNCYLHDIEYIGSSILEKEGYKAINEKLDSLEFHIELFKKARKRYWWSKNRWPEQFKKYY